MIGPWEGGVMGDFTPQKWVFGLLHILKLKLSNFTFHHLIQLKKTSNLIYWIIALRPLVTEILIVVNTVRCPNVNLMGNT